MAGTSTDATKKLLGYEYQKLIALEVCLNAKANQTIYIECYGDVAINDTSIEVKHHFKKSNLNDTHIDFWKTLYNLVNERHNLAAFEIFELHTTSTINEDSIFYEWNKLTKTKKYQRIKSVKSNETIKNKYEGVFALDKKSLQDILSKFSIYPSQVKIEDKVEELLNHDVFKLFPKKNRHHFIDKMLGYITSQAINNSDRWEVVSNDFQKDMSFFAKKFINDDVPFPIISKDEVEVNDSSFVFTDQMKFVGFNAGLIERAVTDYLRAGSSLIQLLASIPAKPIDDFDETLLDLLLDVKDEHTDSIEDDLVSIKNKNISRKMYRECLKINGVKIDGVNDIQPYFYKGRVHSTVESKKFSIFICED